MPIRVAAQQQPGPSSPAFPGMQSSGSPGGQSQGPATLEPSVPQPVDPTSRPPLLRVPTPVQVSPGLPPGAHPTELPAAPRATPAEEEPLSRIEETFQRLLTQKVTQPGVTQREEEVLSDTAQVRALPEAPPKARPGEPKPGRIPEEQKPIRQFGYEVFRVPASTFAPVEDVPVGPDYILGVGDSLTIYVWGTVESVFTVVIDRNGEVFIPRVGTLKVWGLSFEKAEQLIREQLARAFTGFRTSVTLGRLRTIRVFVVGEVIRPGAYTLSALSMVTNALFAAGGPSKQGSLRRIRLLRNNNVVTELDFYEFLLRGDKSRDVRLESGDTVFVPTIGPVVGLVGNVNRPGIYELRGDTSAIDVLAMAGGVAPSGFLQRVQLERFRANTDRVVQDFNLLDFYQRGLREANPALRDGDLLRVFSADTRIYNTVKLEGFIKRPGNYELRPGMRVGDLLTREELLPEAYLERAELVRVKEDLGTEVLQFSIRDVWAGRPDANLELRSLDRVVIKSEFRPGGFVALTGQVKRPGRYALARGERLSSLLERSGGFLPQAFPRGAVFTRESIRRIEQQELNKFLRAQEQALLAESTALTASVIEARSGQEGGLARAQTEVVGQRRELLHSLASAVSLGRFAIRVDSPEKLKGTPEDILLEDGDSLFIPQQPTSVLVLGSVRNSTSILHTENEDVEYYLAKAGGVTREADNDQMYILKADGSALAGFAKVRKVEAGDTIVVPASTEPRYRLIPVLKDLAAIISGFTLPLAAILAISR